MRILNINKFYYQRRGAEKYFFALAALLEKHGHQVIPFSMKDPRNLKSEYEKYFVANLELGDAGKVWGQIKNAGRVLYSLEAKNKISRLLADYPVDMAHIHLIYHHISPSILGQIKSKGIPIVMTLHDYKLICPNYKLYTQGDVCRRCKKYKYYNAVIHKCLKDSYAVGFLAMIELYFHKLFRFYEKYVDVFIAPSCFIRDIMIEFGQDPAKIVYIPHFLEFSSPKKTDKKTKDKQKYLLYAGALAEEKGIDKFLEYFYNYNNKIELRIAGDGPLKAKIKQFIKDKKIKNIKLLGYLSKDVLAEQMRGAEALVVPSVFYEIFGLTVLDAYAQAKPVLAARSGALTELVKDGQTGYLFDITKKESVTKVLDKVLKNSGQLKEMGRKGFDLAHKNFNPDIHYRRIMGVYDKLLQIKRE